MKKVITLFLVVLAISFVATAQVPKPPTGSNNDTKGRGGTVQQEAVSGPIGTATALLLSLGTGTVVYKIKRNKRKKE